MNSNSNEVEAVRVSEIELIQFLREKGKRVPAMNNKGQLMFDVNGKMVMTREKGKPNGIIIAALVDGRIRVGWSCVNKKAGDKFNKERAMNIAKGRLTSPSPIDKVPHRVFKAMDNGFADRCERYFGMRIEN